MVIIIYNCLSIIYYHTSAPTIVIYYVIFQAIKVLISIIFCKNQEEIAFSDYNFNITKEKERNFFINFLDNMNFGVYFAEKGKVVHYNKEILNIAKLFGENTENLY